MQAFFQQTYLLADRCLCHAQFVGRAAKTRMPGRGLEGAECVQRRQAHAHYKSFSNVKVPLNLGCRQFARHV
jgi:hypothetical protein